MESLRKEVEDELKRTRLDKTRLYNLILKLIAPGDLFFQFSKEFILSSKL